MRLRSPIPVWTNVLVTAITLNLGIVSGVGVARANSDAATMQSLQTVLQQLDSAANRKDLTALLQTYSPQFRNSDGLNRKTLEQAIKRLWQDYPDLTYTSEVISTETKGALIEAETVTRAAGKQVHTNGQTYDVEVTLRARQQWQANKLLKQDTLAEQITLSLGQDPPSVAVTLPEQVKAGQPYTYEAIVQEPIGNDLLMGAILDQPITSGSYLYPARLQVELPVIAELLSDRSLSAPVKPSPIVTQVKLQRLRTGGFFKTGKADRAPGQRWISAVFVRHEGGMTIVSQRLNIVGK
jgi:hypothetical protein